MNDLNTLTNKRGGKREGSGRKKGLASITSEEARKYTLNRIYDEIEPIIAGQIEMAKGIYYEKDNIKVYQKCPDNKVAEYLLNQIIGKPKEISEIKLERPVIDINKKTKIDYILGL